MTHERRQFPVRCGFTVPQSPRGREHSVAKCCSLRQLQLKFFEVNSFTGSILLKMLPQFWIPIRFDELLRPVS